MKWQRFHLETRTDSPVDDPDSGAYRVGSPWPVPAYDIVSTDRAGYELRAEIVKDPATDAPVIVGLSVRRLRRLEARPNGSALDWLLRKKKAEAHGELLFAEPPRPLSPRELRRLPLATFLEGARLAAGAHYDAHRRARETGQDQPSPFGPEFARQLSRVRAPRGRPQRGRSSRFYAELAEAYRALAAQGFQHPGAELARRKHEDPNTMRQWIHRARRLGFLDKPTD